METIGQTAPTITALIDVKRHYIFLIPNLQLNEYGLLKIYIKMENVGSSEIHNGDDYRKKLTPEKVVVILQRHGTIVSVDEAIIILEFMRKIADIAVNQYLSSKEE